MIRNVKNTMHFYNNTRCNESPDSLCIH